MKITVYTISDCKFSKEEKDYLTANKLAFEEKNLETNKEFLTEMLAVSNNFAGTPVTKIEKDDGQIVVLKGFTKDEFDKALNLAPVSAPAVAPVAPSPEVKPEPKVEPKVEAPSPIPVAPTPEAPKEAPTPTPSAPAPAPAQPDNDPLKSILADLENKAEPASPVNPPLSSEASAKEEVPPVVANAAANPAPPVIPNFDEK